MRSLIRKIRIPLLVLVLCSASSVPDAVASWQCLRQITERLFPGKVATLDVASAMKEMQSAFRLEWIRRLRVAPESSVGLGREEALALLSTLKKKADPFVGGRNVKNETYFVSLEGNKLAVVKKNATRSDVSFEGKVSHVRNDTSYEVLAFGLDRYLGTDLVPPAVILSKDVSAQLKVAGVGAEFTKAMTLQEHYVDVCHTRLLDYLMVNIDRNFEKNLLELGNHEKIFAIDFDLSRLAPDIHSAPTIKYFENKTVLSKQSGRLSSEALPPVFSKSVIESLRRMSEETLSQIAREHGFVLSDSKKRAILTSKDEVLKMIDDLVKKYGEDVVLIKAD